MVKRMANRKPRTGREKWTSRSSKPGTSFSGATALLIMAIPIIMVPKPIRILPISFLRSERANICIATPTRATKGMIVDGFSRIITGESLWIPFRLRSQAVAVVPRFAPIISPTACDSFMMPELTRPTAITVAAEDDCITAVTAVPNSQLT